MAQTAYSKARRQTLTPMTRQPGVPSGITEIRPINIYDTAPTVLYALKLPIPEHWDGQPILEIFQ